ncbi:MAG TPA: Nif3-like dinuclear metal center hexameric protein [Longimicrobium sp.]|jgi:putative NIF3 family GTP cyclohydrolase 1 type 2|uniref:Nif3-like dinuclear metal center hexameric protein n=1 Tax=Longimicrobium sp. TaxID=2029185 RepID=UPI002ED99FCA
MHSAPSLADLASAVDELLHTADFPDDPPTIFRATSRPVRRMGLALAPDAALAASVREHALDALFLHRPWGAEADLPPDVGILCSHAAFDARLTLGANPQLAAALGLTGVQPFGEHRGRPVGMIGDASPADAEAWRARLVEEFGGVEEAAVPSGASIIHRVALVGAMTDALVRAAAEHGAGLYVTGQMRAPARRAVAESGIAAIAIGHRRSEEHALGLLAALLASRFPGLQTFTPLA